MSYCVHCGVSLEPSERICPLCGTEVQNPRQPFDARARRPYPTRVDPITERVNKQFIAAIITIALVFPSILVMVIDYSYSRKLDWSLIVTGAMLVFWVCVCPLFLLRKPTFLKIAIPVILAIVILLQLIDWVSVTKGWYVELALPLVLLAGILVVIVGQLSVKRKIRGFAIPAAILIAIGLFAVGIELLTEYYAFGSIQVGWSLFVLIPCLALAGVALSIARRQSIHEEIRKRLHL